MLLTTRAQAYTAGLAALHASRVSDAHRAAPVGEVRFSITSHGLGLDQIHFKVLSTTTFEKCFEAYRRKLPPLHGLGMLGLPVRERSLQFLYRGLPLDKALTPATVGMRGGGEGESFEVVQALEFTP